MADIGVAPKAGGQQYTWVWMLVALVAVVALMWWLAAASADLATQTPTVEEAVEGDNVGNVAVGTGELLEFGTVAAEPSAYVGEQIRVENVDVAATLGPRAFWADVPGQNPFLVVLGPELSQVSELAGGERLHLAGTIQALDDAVLDEWEQEGALREGAREEVSFIATHYLMANSLAEAPTAPAASE